MTRPRKTSLTTVDNSVDDNYAAYDNGSGYNSSSYYAQNDNKSYDNAQYYRPIDTKVDPKEYRNPSYSTSTSTSVDANIRNVPVTGGDGSLAYPPNQYGDRPFESVPYKHPSPRSYPNHQEGDDSRSKHSVYRPIHHHPGTSGHISSDDNTAYGFVEGGGNQEYVSNSSRYFAPSRTDTLHSSGATETVHRDEHDSKLINITNGNNNNNVTGATTGRNIRPTTDDPHQAGGYDYQNQNYYIPDQSYHEIHSSQYISTNTHTSANIHEGHNYYYDNDPKNNIEGTPIDSEGSNYDTYYQGATYANELSTNAQYVNESNANKRYDNANSTKQEIYQEDNYGVQLFHKNIHESYENTHESADANALNS